MKRLLKKIFILPVWMTALIAVPAFALVIFALTHEEVPMGLGLASYILSAYALILIITCLLRLKHVRWSEMRWVRRIPMGERILKDSMYRGDVALHIGLAYNLLYALAKLSAGVWIQSLWFFFLGIYYLTLAAMKFVLVRYLRHAPAQTDTAAERRKGRTCGGILLILNLILSGIVAQIVGEGQTFSYPGYWIYAMAFYTFANMISAVRSVFRYRKKGSPVRLATKAVSLTSALVSMLSLETAMITQFGDGDEAFRRTMIIITGAVVCGVVLLTALLLILKEADNHE